AEVALMTSAMIGDSPVLLLVLPLPEAAIPISMWISPSAEILLWGKMNCHRLAPNCGYCASASGEIWRLSASHKPAIWAISGRVLVIMVVAPAGHARSRAGKTTGRNHLEFIIFCGATFFRPGF